MISELCVCDVLGNVSVVLYNAGHIEAPNWHPGGYLIVNGDGRLYCVGLDKPTLEVLNTAFAITCNNDHGIYPDRALLGMSDKSRTTESCIYTMPIEARTPTRITPDIPSWWHGWSPDGTTLTYVGARGDRMVKLCTLDLLTHNETLICSEFDHIDGPDYSPDGRWI